MQAAASMIYLAASLFFAAAFDAVKKLSFACFTAHPDVYILDKNTMTSAQSTTGALGALWI